MPFHERIPLFLMKFLPFLLEISRHAFLASFPLGQFHCNLNFNNLLPVLAEKKIQNNRVPCID